MNKNDFIKLGTREEKELYANIYDKIILCQKTKKTLFTNEFVIPKVWKCLEDIKFDGVSIYNNGIFPEAERKMLAFSYDDIQEYPIKIIKVHNKSKFSNPKHKDYLGALMSLGFRREKFGDLIVVEDCCFFPAAEEIIDFLLSNMNSIGKSPCELVVLENLDEQIFTPKVEKKIITVASRRIDCIISELTGLSRSKAEDMLSMSKVLLDYIPQEKRDFIVKDDSIIAIRGYGKFKIKEQKSISSKGKFRLEVYKYI